MLFCEKLDSRGLHGTNVLNKSFFDDELIFLLTGERVM